MRESSAARATCAQKFGSPTAFCATRAPGVRAGGRQPNTFSTAGPRALPRRRQAAAAAVAPCSSSSTRCAPDLAGGRGGLETLADLRAVQPVGGGARDLGDLPRGGVRGGPRPPALALATHHVEDRVGDLGLDVVGEVAHDLAQLVARVAQRVQQRPIRPQVAAGQALCVGGAWAASSAGQRGPCAQHAPCGGCCPRPRRAPRTGARPAAASGARPRAPSRPWLRFDPT
jgi:hypothetical protein